MLSGRLLERRTSILWALPAPRFFHIVVAAKPRQRHEKEVSRGLRPPNPSSEKYLTSPLGAGQTLLNVELDVGMRMNARKVVGPVCCNSNYSTGLEKVKTRNNFDMAAATGVPMATVESAQSSERDSHH